MMTRIFASVRGSGAERRRPTHLAVLNSAETYWGAEHSLVELARVLHAQGISTSLVTFNEVLANRWTVERLGEVRLLKRRPTNRIWRGFRLVIEARRLMHVHTWILFNFDLLPIVPLLRMVGPSSRVVLDLHDFLPGSRGRAFLRSFSNMCTGVVCVSEFVSSQVSSKVRKVILARPVAGIHGAQNRDYSSVRTIGIIGRIDEAKNHVLGIDAVAMLPAPITLLIRGQSAYGDESYLHRVTKEGERRLGDRFCIERPRPPAQALEDVDVLLVCNSSEPLGRTVAEAQCAGIPVIVPDQGGSQELVAHLSTGLIFSANSPSSLADAIWQLASNGELTRDLATRAQLIANARHNPLRYAESYTEFLGIDLYPKGGVPVVN